MVFRKTPYGPGDKRHETNIIVFPGQYRTNMFAGNIVLADTKTGFIDSAIKWFTQSNFSHSFITMPDTLGFPMCIEAASSGVDMTRFDTGYENNLNEGYEVWSINIDQSIKEHALQQIINDLEISYGFLEYPYFILRRICLFFGKNIQSMNNPFRKDGMICSQLCVSYLQACQLQYVLTGYGQGSISPQDLQNIFKSYPNLFKLEQSVRMPT